MIVVGAVLIYLIGVKIGYRMGQRKMQEQVKQLALLLESMVSKNAKLREAIKKG